MNKKKANILDYEKSEKPHTVGLSNDAWGRLEVYKASQPNKIVTNDFVSKAVIEKLDREESK